MAGHHGFRVGDRSQVVGAVDIVLGNRRFPAAVDRKVENVPSPSAAKQDVFDVQAMPFSEVEPSTSVDFQPDASLIFAFRIRDVHMPRVVHSGAERRQRQSMAFIAPSQMLHRGPSQRGRGRSGRVADVAEAFLCI